MNQLVKHLLWTTAIAPVLLSQSVSAHVIWFEQINPTRGEIFFGHPEEGTPEPFDLNKFTGANAYDISGNVIPSTTTFTNGRLFINTVVPAAAYSGSYDNGFWRENPDGSYDNITAEEAAEIGFENTGQYLKYATGIFNEDFPISRSFGQPLEIRPQSSPFDLTAGDTLPVRVFFNNSLLTNPLVEYQGNEIPVNNGVALIPIGLEGLEVIEASYSDPNANNPTLSYAATFSTLGYGTIVPQPEPIPEPLTILGTLFTLGVLPVLKKNYNK